MEMNLDNPEPMKENSLVPAELVELSSEDLREASGGDIGSGLIVIPR